MLPKQRSTHRKASRTCKSTRGMTLRTRSPAARTGTSQGVHGRQGVTIARHYLATIFLFLIQEVVQSLSRGGPHSHDDSPRHGKNTSHQLTQTNAAHPRLLRLQNPVTNSTLTIEDIPSLLQQVLRALAFRRPPPSTEYPTATRSGLRAK